MHTTQHRFLKIFILWVNICILLTSAQSQINTATCPHGESFHPTPEHKSTAPTAKYKLPFPPNTTLICSRSTGHGIIDGIDARYSFDFAHNPPYEGTPITAARAGIVKRAYDQSTTGGANSNFANLANFVVIDHLDGEESVYLHLQPYSVPVQVGECVEQGQVIGKLGNTGWSTNPHLHFHVQSSNSISWWANSIPIAFIDFAQNGGRPNGGDYITSGAPIVQVNNGIPIYGGDWGTPGFFSPKNNVVVRFNHTNPNLTLGSISNLSIDGNPIPAPINLTRNNQAYSLHLNLSTQTFAQSYSNYRLSFNIDNNGIQEIAIGNIYFLSPQVSSFIDIEPNSNYESNIIRGVEYGIFRGIGNTFQPDAFLSRAQAAVVIINMATLLDTFQVNAAIGANGQFSDVGTCHWAFPYIQTLRNRNTINIVPNYRPEDPISLGEFCKILSNTLGLSNLPSRGIVANLFQKPINVIPNDNLKPFVETVFERVVLQEKGHNKPFIYPLMSFLFPNSEDINSTSLLTRAEMARLMTNLYETKYEYKYNQLPQYRTQEETGSLETNSLVDLSKASVIGNLYTLPSITSGNAPTINGVQYDYDLFDDQSLKLVYASEQDPQGNPLAFYWTTNDGDLLPDTSYANYRAVDFTPPTVLDDSIFSILLWVGSANGKVEEAIINVHVQPANRNTGPDATIQTVNISDISPVQGTYTDVTYTIANTGSQAPSTDIMMDIIISSDSIIDGSDITVASVNAGQLGQNQTYTGTTTVNIPMSLQGNYYLLLEADPNNLISESLESNNSYIAQLSIQADCNGSSILAAAVFAPFPNAVDSVQFIDSSQNAVSRIWDFGNGQSSTLANPVMTFASGQNYNICLTAMDANGCTDSICESYSVTAYLEVLHPVDTTVMQKGVQNVITWTDNLSHSFQVSLYKGANFIGHLAAAVQSPDTFLTWTPPTTLQSGGDYRILIQSNVDGSILDYSEYFWIADSLIGDINIVDPNSTSMWQMGHIYDILWLDQIGDDVKILLLQNGNVVDTIASATASDGHYSYMPSTSLAQGNYQIQICNVNDPSINDISAPFFISNSLDIEITFPDQYTTLSPGNTYVITWLDNIPDTDSVIIRLYKGGAFIETIVAKTPADGAFTWTIPTHLTPCSDYRLLISYIVDGNVFDYSSYFWIYPHTSYPIEVIYPSSSSLFQHNKTYGLRWHDTNNGDVKIQLYRDAAYVGDITLSTPSDGYHEWTVPNTLVPDSTYRILITRLSNGSIVDYSEYFTITDPIYFEWVYPDATTIWERGQSVVLIWETNVPDRFIRINAYNGSAYWEPVVTSTPNDSIHVWSVPINAPLGDDFRFLAEIINEPCSANDYVFDYTDYFSIDSAQAIQVTQPISSTVIRHSSNLPIVWNQNIPGSNRSGPDTVTIELWRYGSKIMDIVTDHIVLGGNTSYDWMPIPSHLPEGVGYRVRVVSEISGSYDFSESFRLEGDPLPIILTNIVGEFNDNTQSIDLKWNIETDQPIDKVIIEHSSNGIDFDKVGQVIAPSHIGNQLYQFRHHDYHQGNNHYRLFLLDQNGERHNFYNRVLTITPPTIRITIVPNPANGFTQVRLPSSADYQIKIRSIEGKLVHDSDRLKDVQSYEFDATQLSPGVYFLEVHDGKNKATQKFSVTQ